MPAPSRRALAETLRRHDLAEAIAEAVRRMGITLRERTLRDPREFAAFVDAATGEQLGEIVAGTASRVDVGPLLTGMVPGHRYVCVHSHPEDDSFSPHDVALVLRFPAVCVVAVVGRRGAWFVLSADPDRRQASEQQMVDVFNAERETIVPKYLKMVQAGLMTRREAQAITTHEVWERIAPTLGLRYDRV